MEDLQRFIREIVDPTVAEFGRHPASVRHGFLACVVTCHAADYLGYPKKRDAVRQAWRKESPDFELVDRVAHAFKHVESDGDTRKGVRLKAKHVTSRPPAIFGQMKFGVSLFGDPVGAVLAEGKELLQVVRRAVEFIRQKSAPDEPPRQPTRVR
jgi:hypothetical protein